MILSAQVTDAKYLTEIALQSKAFWGYADDLLKTWQNDLTVTCKMIKERTVFTYIDKKEILGIYTNLILKCRINTLNYF